MRKPHFSEQLIGFVWLFLIIAGVAISMLCINRNDRKREQTMEQRAHVRFVEDSLQQVILQHEVQRELWQQQKEERARKHAEWEKRHAAWERQKAEWKKKKEAEEHIEIILQPFDPNTADSTTFVHLGLRPWMAQSILHYRAKGGRYRKADDFRKVYGMTDTLFSVLRPYIQITDGEQADTLQHPLYISHKRDTILKINTADTASLQWLRGVGRWTAVQIIRRREQLGGFASLNQLREIENLQHVDSILPHLTVNPALIRKVAINRLSVGAMMKHKYISFDQAKAIRDYRHRHGSIRDWETLRHLRLNGKEVFTDEDIRRLQPYISFEE